MRRLLFAVLAASVMAGSATADVIVVPLTVRPGGLALAPVTTNAMSSRIAVMVVDARGHGAGWTLLVRPSVTSGSPVAVTSVELHCGYHSTCTLPGNDTRYPVMLSPVRPTPVVSARRGTGMGAIEVVVKLARPARPGGLLRFSLRPS